MFGGFEEEIYNRNLEFERKEIDYLKDRVKELEGQLSKNNKEIEQKLSHSEICDLVNKYIKSAKDEPYAGLSFYTILRWLDINNGLKRRNCKNIESEETK
jgi:molybdopterin converting factor small subunit